MTINDLKLCDTKYHEYLQLAAMQQDPEAVRLLKNIAYSWSRIVRQLERYHDKTRKAVKSE